MTDLFGHGKQINDQREQWLLQQEDNDRLGGYGRQRQRDDNGGMFMAQVKRDHEQRRYESLIYEARELFMHGELMEQQGNTLVKAEIDSQIATAKAYPRGSVKPLIEAAGDMMCFSPEIAEQCFYSVPRGGKQVEGASSRFAEVLCSQWKNCRSGSRIIAENQDTVVAEGMYLDLENNTATQAEVTRSIVDKHGKRYGVDMITTTKNAALSIAQRNAVLKGIPKCFWEGLLTDVRKAAIGDVKQIADTRAKVVASFAKLGVTAEELLDLLKCPSIEDITPDNIATLRGTYRGLVEGEINVDETFRGAPADIPKPKKKTPRKKSKTVEEDAAEKIADQTPYPVWSPAGEECLLEFIRRWKECTTEEELTKISERVNSETQRLGETEGPKMYDLLMKDYTSRLMAMRSAAAGK